MGSAISGAIWTGTLLPKLEAYLPPGAQADASLIYGNLTIARSYLEGTPERGAIDRAYQETMDVLLIVAVCLCVPVLGLSFLMRNYRLDRIDQKVKGKVIGGERHGGNAEAVDGIDERPRGMGESEGEGGKRKWFGFGTFAQR